MNKFRPLLIILPLLLAIFLLAGCALNPVKPVVAYQTKEVNVPVPVMATPPDVPKFESRVMLLSDESTDGEVGKAYKQDWLTLMLRDRLFTNFLDEYRKAKQNVEAERNRKD